MRPAQARGVRRSKRSEWEVSAHSGQWNRAEGTPQPLQQAPAGFTKCQSVAIFFHLVATACPRWQDTASLSFHRETGHVRSSIHLVAPPRTALRYVGTDGSPHYLLRDVVPAYRPSLAGRPPDMRNIMACQIGVHGSKHTA